MIFKLRTIVGGDRNVQGLTVPDDIAIFFSGCMFTAAVSGTCIVYYSGTSKVPTKKEVEDYKFEDCITGSLVQNEW